MSHSFEQSSAVVKAKKGRRGKFKVRVAETVLPTQIRGRQRLCLILQSSLPSLSSQRKEYQQLQGVDPTSLWKLAED
ncbi:unnamed protein product [Sphagnum balticum]